MNQSRGRFTIISLATLLALMGSLFSPLLPTVLAHDNPIQISDWHGLNNVRNDLDGDYVLVNNLDENTAGYDEWAGPAAHAGAGWEPIGDYHWDPDHANPFTGELDGDGYEIRDLRINRFEDQVGLFGFIDGGEVRNLTVDNAEVTANGGTDSVSEVGILAGMARDFTLDTVTVVGHVIAEAGYGEDVRRIGIFAGEAGGDWTVTKSSAAGDITINAGDDVRKVGIFAGEAGDDWTVTKSSAAGDITINAGDDVREIGLFVGEAGDEWTATDSSAAGDITITAGDSVDAVGIFAGDPGSGWTVTKSSAAGDITINAGSSVPRIGIFAGGRAGGDWTVTDSSAQGNIAIDAGRDAYEIGIFAGGRAGGDWTVTDSSAQGNITIDAGRDVEEIGIFVGDARDDWTVTDSSAAGDITIKAEEDVEGIGIFAGDTGHDWEVTNSSAAGDITIDAGGGVDEVGIFAGDPWSSWTVQDSSAEGDITINAGEGVRRIGIFAGDPTSDWTFTDSSATGDITIYAGDDVREIGIFAGNPGSWTVTDSSAEGDITITAGGFVREIGIFAGDTGSWTVTDSSAAGDITITAGEGVYEIGIFAGDTGSWTVTDSSAAGDITITAGEGVYEIGIFAGDPGNWTVTNSSATGDITIGAGDDVEKVGIFAGDPGRWTVTDSSAEGDITIDARDDVREIGLFAGGTGSDWNVTRTGVSGRIEVESIDAEAEVRAIGGFIGLLGEDGELSEVFAIGSVSLQTHEDVVPENVGGLVGEASPGATLTDSYADVDINSGVNVGGLVGLNSGVISKTYATGAVAGDEPVGGLVGLNQAEGGITDSFSDKDTTNQDAPVGDNEGTVDNVQALPTEEIKEIDTFTDAGWDIELTTEDDPTGGYPFLSWQLSDSPTWYIYFDDPIRSIETATGTGTAFFTPSEGAIEQLTAVSEQDLPEDAQLTMPDLEFPHDFFSLNIEGVTEGGTVTVSITLPESVPADTEYWKYYDDAWHEIPMTIDPTDDRVIIITLVDGGLGDADLTEDGRIVDPGGPGNPEPPPVIPPVGGTGYLVNRLALLAPWIALAAVMAGALVFVKRRQAQS